MATQAADTPHAEAEPARALVPVSAERDAYVIMKDKARNFAMSALLPDAIKGNSPDQAFANCLIALQMAEAMGEMPLVVMQNIHIVKGKAGFAAQYMIARANASGIFKGRINWRVDKSDPDNLSVTAYAALAETGEIVEFTVDMAMARAENWTSNSKYKTMPEVMLRYRSATFLVRFYAPDVMLGYRTSEEYEDVAASVMADTRAAPALTANMLVDQSRPAEAVDADTGEVETVEAEPVEEAPHEDGMHAGDNEPDDQAAALSPAEQYLAGIRERIESAGDKAALKKADDDWVKNRVAYDDEVAGEIDGLIAAKRRAMAGEG